MDSLTDGVVLLRPFRHDDVPAIAAACSDPDVARFIPGMPVPYTEEDARAFVERCTDVRSAGPVRPCAIADTKTDTLLGAIDVRRSPRAEWNASS